MDEGLEMVLAAVREHGLDVEAYEALGEIKATLHPNGELLIFNYTQFAQFAGTWNPVERVCRGLIIHWPTVTARARAFDKFFNLGQLPEAEYTALPQGVMEVTEKMDGSLGVLYWDGVDWAIATRGSFTSEQAIWATHHLHERYDVSGLSRDVTLLFEILYPNNRIVLDYGAREDLVLIGARFNDGRDCGYSDLTRYAETFGFPLVPRIEVDSLEALSRLATQRLGEEGWVVRFANGFRVKIKTDEYVRLHKLLTRVTARSIWEMLMTGQSIEPLLEKVPDEFYAWVSATIADLTTQFQDIEQTARLNLIPALPLETRKEQAAVISQSTYPGVTFRMLDNKSYADQIWKMIRPAHIKPFKVDEE